MTKTFMASLPDRAGTMLAAARIIHRHGGSMRRASYNKAVDAHMLFLDVEADETALTHIERDLTAAGFLSTGDPAQVVLVEAIVPDVSGALIPILEVLEQQRISISYLSSQSGANDTVGIKMGLYMQSRGAVDALMARLRTLCEVRLLSYGVGEKKMDNSTFYLTFAREMRDLLHLDEKQSREFITMSNRVMQLLDEKGEPHSKTFEYVSRFAHFVAEHRGEHYDCRISRETLTERVSCAVIEPPCGSNITVLEDGESGELLIIDGGFACFVPETMKILRELFGEWDSRAKSMLLTHSDSDHTGLCSEFDRIYCTRRTADCFAGEHMGLPCPREENPNMLPYYRLSKLITDYVPPVLNHLVYLDQPPGDDDVPLSPIGRFRFGDLDFTVLQGNGGHVPGETVLLDEKHCIAITGDDYINVRDQTDGQRAFTRLAPYLARSVNQDSPRYHAILKELRGLLGSGEWLILPGHGAIIPRETKE